MGGLCSVVGWAQWVHTVDGFRWRASATVAGFGCWSIWDDFGGVAWESKMAVWIPLDIWQWRLRSLAQSADHD